MLALEQLVQRQERLAHGHSAATMYLPLLVPEGLLFLGSRQRKECHRHGSAGSLLVLVYPVQRVHDTAAAMGIRKGDKARHRLRIVQHFRIMRVARLLIRVHLGHLDNHVRHVQRERCAVRISRPEQGGRGRHHWFVITKLLRRLGDGVGVCQGQREVRSFYRSRLEMYQHTDARPLTEPACVGHRIRICVERCRACVGQLSAGYDAAMGPVPYFDVADETKHSEEGAKVVGALATEYLRQKWQLLVNRRQAQLVLGGLAAGQCSHACEIWILGPCCRRSIYQAHAFHRRLALCHLHHCHHRRCRSCHRLRHRKSEGLLLHCLPPPSPSPPSRP